MKTDFLQQYRIWTLTERTLTTKYGTSSRTPSLLENEIHAQSVYTDRQGFRSILVSHGITCSAA